MQRQARGRVRMDASVIPIKQRNSLGVFRITFVQLARDTRHIRCLRELPRKVGSSREIASSNLRGSFVVSFSPAPRIGIREARTNLKDSQFEREKNRSQIGLNQLTRRRGTVVKSDQAQADWVAKLYLIKVYLISEILYWKYNSFHEFEGDSQLITQL